MARLARYVLPGHPQHVIQRGNNRGTIFYEEADYLFYLDKLKQSSEEHGCLIHSYVLMTNHVHLLVTPLREDSISKMQQMLGCYYVQYFNHRYQRTGTLWEGRYRATLIDHETYLFICMCYIEMNPVRARMVVEASDYRWSSYPCNALGEENLLISPHGEYTSLGLTCDTRRHAYQELCDQQIPTNTLNEIRQLTHKSWILGSTAFKNKVESLLERRGTPNLKGGDRKSEQYKLKTNRV